MLCYLPQQWKSVLICKWLHRFDKNPSWCCPTIFPMHLSSARNVEKQFSFKSRLLPETNLCEVNVIRCSQFGGGIFQLQIIHFGWTTIKTSTRCPPIQQKSPIYSWSKAGRDQNAAVLQSELDFPLTWRQLPRFAKDRGFDQKDCGRSQILTSNIFCYLFSSGKQIKLLRRKRNALKDLNFPAP